MPDSRSPQHAAGVLVGDADGLVDAGPQRQSFSDLAHHPAVAWVALAVALAVTILGWSVSNDIVQRRAHDRFQFLAAEVVTAIERRMADYMFALRAGAGLFEWSDEVTRSEWMGFHRTLDIERAFPGIEGYGFARIVPDDQLEAYALRVRGEGFPDYAVHPTGNSGVHAVVEYIAPFADRNLRALGYDMYADPVRREAMERARDTGAPALSGKLTLIQESGAERQNGVVMYLPIYRPKAALNTVADRRDALKGFIAGAFRMGDLMRGVLGGGIAGVEFEIFDGREAAPARLLVRESGSGTAAAGGGDGSGDGAPLFLAERVIEIVGRPWALRMWAAPGFAQTPERYLPLLVAAAVGGIDLLLFALVVVISGRHKRALALAQEMTRDFRLARAEAERANTAKSAFLARMSHEFRTPLTAIIGYSDLILEGMPGPLLPEKYETYIRRIHTGGNHLLSLVGQLLDLSAIEAGRHQLHPEGLDIDELLDEADGMVRPLAEQAELTLRVEVAPGTPVVWADRRAVKQVMVNLIGNGVKFTPAGGVVNVRVKPADDPAWVVFTVTDTGRGIAQEDMDRVLEPFVTSAGSDGVEGTGLGLPISKALVELHGGRFTVESAVGVGTTVTFTLPAMVSG